MTGGCPVRQAVRSDVGIGVGVDVGEGWDPVPARAQLQWPRPSATVPSVLANRGRGRTPATPSSLWSNNDRESVYEGSLREPPRFPVRLGHFQCARADTGSQPVTVGGSARG